MCGRYALYGPITRAILLALGLCLFASCGKFAESCFDLSPTSRLPAWFSLPTGSSRDRVTVHMCYYIDRNGRTATFELRNRDDGSVLAKVEGNDRGLHPVTAKNTEPAPFEYPLYEVISVGEITEVVEHRRADAVFYIVDEPSILRGLGVGGS
jgi:hypothetical protein